MNGAEFQREVHIGWQDGRWAIGVKPPLSEEEIRSLEYAGVIAPSNTTQIDEPEPGHTLITIPSKHGSLPETRTIDVAQEIGGQIVSALNNWGGGEELAVLVPMPEYTPGRIASFLERVSEKLQGS